MVTKSMLENGIRVVTETIPHVRSISMSVLVDAGPVDEKPHQSGLAHLCEHMMFQGTSNRSALEIARLMDGSGGQVGGFVTRDYTCYHATVLDDYRYHALDLLGDVLLNSTFPPEALARQRETVAREIEMRRDSGAERAQSLLKERAWAGHYLGRAVTGTPESVRRLTREDVIFFVHRHYTPDRITVAAAGNLEHEDFTAQVRDAFWRMLGAGPRRPAVEPPFHGGVTVETAPVGQASFALGLPALPFDHADRYGLHILSRLLGGGISSRLFHAIREEQALAYHIASDYHAYRDGGMLLIEGTTPPENLQPVLRRVLSELRLLATGEAPVSEEDRRRAITQLLNQHLISRESTHTRMSRLATQEIYFGHHLPDGEVLAAIEGVGADSLRRLTERWLLASLPSAALAVVAPPGRPGSDVGELEGLLAASLHLPSAAGRRARAAGGPREPREREECLALAGATA